MRKSVLNSINIRWILDSFDRIDLWCDYLSVNYKDSVEKLDWLLFWIDTDNSNFAVYDFNDKEFTYVKTPTSIGWALTFNYVYNWVSFPLLQYVKFNKQTRLLVWKSWKINVYWSYYRLEEIGEFRKWYIIDLIKDFSDEDPRISRYDYRVDYFSVDNVIDVPEINQVLDYLSPQSSTIKYFEWDKLIDWSVWKSDTWRYKIRYYDKKIDTDKKNKWILYSDFVKYKSVHRFEFEFLTAFCRFFKLSQIHDLEWKIIDVLKISNHMFQDSLFYTYDSDCEITDDNAWKFIQRYINLSKKLLKAWYSPYQLIEEAIIWTYWKDVAIWLLEDFINKSLVWHETYHKFNW